MSDTAYPGLAQLRQDLNSDERGRMLDAADTVRDAGLSVDEVLSDEPPREDLVNAGIIPESGDERPAAEYRQEMIDLLEEIRDGLGGGTA